MWRRRYQCNVSIPIIRTMWRSVTNAMFQYPLSGQCDEALRYQWNKRQHSWERYGTPLARAGTAERDTILPRPELAQLREIRYSPGQNWHSGERYGTHLGRTDTTERYDTPFEREKRYSLGRSWHSWESDTILPWPKLALLKERYDTPLAGAGTAERDTILPWLELALLRERYDTPLAGVGTAERDTILPWLELAQLREIRYSHGWSWRSWERYDTPLAVAAWNWTKSEDVRTCMSTMSLTSNIC